MSVSASRRTWEEASSPAAVRLAREFEQAWQDSDRQRRRPDPCDFHGSSGDLAEGPGTRLALLRADMALRREAGEPVGAQWYLDRYSDLGEDTIVALIYEEFCLREEEDETKPDAADFLERFPQVEKPLRRVLEIHQLVSAERSQSFRPSTLGVPSHFAPPDNAFPEAGQTISGFHLVEELGRGSFARVFLAKELELANRLVAIKVTRRGSREPQTLARLQHTHIVPVYSHRIDTTTGLHLLCMPYFGRITLARLLADDGVKRTSDGTGLIEAIDRIAPGESPTQGRSAGRLAVGRRSYPLAIAWWGARLAEALDHAHDRGILHRDIKPSNVLVTPDGMPMLLDFNLAHEPVVDGGSSTADTLGGTLDYMSPEHLKALAENAPGQVDIRSDIYSLGIVLYEAVVGRRPYSSPRRGASIGEALLRAADERLVGPPRLRHANPEVPAALEAVIRCCLEPEPLARYQSAARLAADLQAVADDHPLVHAQEPWHDRLASWVRRNQRKLISTAAAIALVSVLAVGLLGFAVISAEPKRLRQIDFDKGTAAEKSGDFNAALQFYESAADEHRTLDDYRIRFKDWRQVLAAASSVISKLGELRIGSHDDVRVLAAEKAQLAKRTAETRAAAQAVFVKADDLRFQFLQNNDPWNLANSTLELKKVLEPFFVFKSVDWTKLDHILRLLKKEQTDRLIPQVNELLFLWLCTIDDAVAPDLEGLSTEKQLRARSVLENALAECDHSLVFAEPKPPWQALRARLAARLAKAELASSASGLSDGVKKLLPGEPANVGNVASALACLQWSLLHSRGDHDTLRAIDWMQQAVRIQPNDYWYNFCLAYLEDSAGFKEPALKDYSIAVALKPDSPWVRFDRAKLYRSRGLYYRAIEDLDKARDGFESAKRPEVENTYLELGYLSQLLGQDKRAREYYAKIKNDLGARRAARLNLANLSADSGATRWAIAELNTLLFERPDDSAARHSRALLALRLGLHAGAESDLTSLLEHEPSEFARDELLAERALARLSLGVAGKALIDSSDARLLNPSPANERLHQRALLSARRYDLLQLENPEELAYFPLAGHRLRAEMERAAADLKRVAFSETPAAYRASLNLAVIVSALHRHAEADDAATRAILMSPYSHVAYLVRGRIRLAARQLDAARADVATGLSIQPDDADLVLLKGRVLLADGEPSLALTEFDHAIAMGTHDSGHALKARVLTVLGRDQEAINQWSLALRRDPALSELFLGRARSYIAVARWDDALVDLDQALSWSHGDTRTELAISWTYLCCLPARPGHLQHWFELIKRITTEHSSPARVASTDRRLP